MNTRQLTRKEAEDKWVELITIAWVDNHIHTVKKFSDEYLEEYLNKLDKNDYEILDKKPTGENDWRKM